MPPNRHEVAMSKRAARKRNNEDKRTIVAIGGGGFSLDDEQLDDYVVSLVKAARPCICFLPTASGDADAYITRFYARFDATRFCPSHLSLFRRSINDLRSHILQQDIVYVGGGNTANLLAVWAVHGLNEVLREAWQAGIILCGISAGAICWFQGGVTDSFGTALRPVRNGLGLLAGSFCPHANSEASRRSTYSALIAADELAAGIIVDDGVALRFEAERLREIVATNTSCQAWRISRIKGGVREDTLTPRVLTAMVERRAYE
jgi:dipeptidase E